MTKTLFFSLCSLVLSFILHAAEHRTFQDRYPLHSAAQSGDVLQVTSLCGHIDVNQRDSNNNTPLHFAASKGHQEIVTLLIAAGAGANQTDEDGNTPLHLAAYHGHKEIAKMLIAAGADANHSDKYGKTPLHLAAYYGRQEVVQVLLGHHASLDQKNIKGNTPLLIAATLGHQEVVQVLLAAGADFNVTDRMGHTPVDLAGINNHPETAHLIRLWPVELQPQFLNGLHASRCAFLAVSHLRCGNNSSANVLDLHIMRNIDSFLRPSACIYSHEMVKRYIDMYQAEQPCGYIIS